MESADEVEQRILTVDGNTMQGQRIIIGTREANSY
jgi:hypothetical protein